MKAVMLVLSPEECLKAFNGDLSVLVRKKFPKDYVGWVYIYCTKDKKYANLINRGGFLTGMVVARFWCDKVEHFEYETCSRDISGYFLDNGEKFNTQDNCKKMCLYGCDLWNYIGCREGYAIHITKLEIFDKPKEISEFYHYTTKRDNVKGIIHDYEELTRAPQSFCFIEV